MGEVGGLAVGVQQRREGMVTTAIRVAQEDPCAMQRGGR
jgi:hypothetical protein